MCFVVPGCHHDSLTWEQVNGGWPATGTTTSNMNIERSDTGQRKLNVQQSKFRRKYRKAEGERSSWGRGRHVIDS